MLFLEQPQQPPEGLLLLLVFGRQSYTRDVTWKHPREAVAGLLLAAWGMNTPSPRSTLSEAQMPPEDTEVWYEPAPVPSRTSPGPEKPSPVTSRTSPEPSPVTPRASPVISRASPESAQPSPVWKSRASPGPAQQSLVLSRASPGPAQPTQSQSSLLSHQEQHQHPALSHQLPRGLMDDFAGVGDGGEPQKLGRTRAQAARNQPEIDRPQTVNDGVAQLERTRGQSVRSQGCMQHGLLFDGCAGGYWSCNVPSSPTAQEPSPTLGPGE